jgi:hypothetical protein
MKHEPTNVLTATPSFGWQINATTLPIRPEVGFFYFYFYNFSGGIA